MVAARFLRNPIAAVPCALHTVPTDRAIGTPSVRETMARGIPFANRACDRHAFHRIFHRVCDEHGIEHRLTRLKHPWSREDQKTVRGTVFPNGGQVERMNRTIEEATVKRLHDDDHDRLRRHLHDFIDAYNFGRRLKTLKGLTPYEFISNDGLQNRTVSNSIISIKYRD